MGEDSNARTGCKGGLIRTGDRKVEEKRKSIDKVINKEGRILLEKLGERGWTILNGSFGKEGEWTFIGEAGTSVIDYVITNVSAWEEVKAARHGLIFFFKQLY